MTAPLSLSAIREQLAGITPGPWVWTEETNEWGDCGPNLETVERGEVYSDGSQGAKEQVIGSWGHDANGISIEPNDAAFIAAAPSTVEQLLGALERVEANALQDARAEGWDEAHFGALGCDASCCDFMHGAPEKDMNPYREDT